jgi:hypothetical protein
MKLDLNNLKLKIFEKLNTKKNSPALASDSQFPAELWKLMVAIFQQRVIPATVQSLNAILASVSV